MKITKIELKDFHQFKDMTLDLTYPAGHAKAGQPLDKVCFIGQSGTGKTTLLELIPKFLANYDTKYISKIDVKSLYDAIDLNLAFGYNNEYEVNTYFNHQKNHTDWYWTTHKKSSENSREYIANGYDIFSTEWLDIVMSKPVYFPANLDYDLDVKETKNLAEKRIIDFSKEKVSRVWNLILESIQKYQEQEIQIQQEVIKTIQESSVDFDITKKAFQKLEEWKQNEFNPIQDVADKCLDKLLQYFKLRVKTKLDFKTKEDIGFIKIEDYHDNEIPDGLWSTGTKQVVLSALPLYLLKPRYTVILFDEPERSLYPDLQRLIIDFYSSLTENCQFFYSTHSPIIASSFEPWEIVELKFNEEGHIYRELYYQGENHVDNYKLNPQLMRWDDILQRIFNMADDGSEKRAEKLEELATYNVKYKKLKKQNKENTPEAKDILENIATLSKDLSYWKNLYAQD